jgi:hypothetical protein
MTGIVTIVCLVLALGVVATTGVHALRDRPADTSDVVVAGLLELGVLVYVAVRTVDLAGGHRTSSLVLAVCYLVGIVLVMPVTVLLGLAERSRWGPVVIGVGALVVCVLFARVQQLWTPHG